MEIVERADEGVVTDRDQPIPKMSVLWKVRSVKNRAQNPSAPKVVRARILKKQKRG